VYHKSYELGSPIEIQVWPDKIEILSFPGPVPPVNTTVLKTHRRIVAREYRNRRIGDFLKELHLTEGRGTGFPTIYKAMADNGSPVPSFETDETSTYLLATLPAHDSMSNGASNGVNVPVFKDLKDILAFGNGASNGASNGVRNLAIEIINTEVHDRVYEILEILTVRMKRSELFEKMDLSNQSKNRAKYLDPLIENGWVEMEFPKERPHPNQTYQVTVAGNRILKLLNNGN
jgi:ATP-dependent DNA helicase RecG